MQGWTSSSRMCRRQRADAWSAHVSLVTETGCVLSLGQRVTPHSGVRSLIPPGPWPPAPGPRPSPASVPAHGLSVRLPSRALPTPGGPMQAEEEVPLSSNYMSWKETPV